MTGESDVQTVRAEAAGPEPVLLRKERVGGHP